MIRTNLSTRPFYNERIVALTLLLVAVIALAATLFNVTRVIRYSRSDTTLALRADQDEARAAQLRASAARLRGSVDQKQIDFASNEARQANQLIDRRTFSWTELFNRFETTLPDDARITSVRPRIGNDGRIELSITVVARGVEDVNRFVENLDATGAFSNLRPTDERFDDQQLLSAMIEATYTPGAAPAARPAAAQKGGR